MRKLVRRALKSIDRLDRERLHSLVQELVDDNEQLEMVLSSIPGGVIVIGRDHKVLMINTPARRLIPLTVTEPLDRLVWETIATAELSRYIRQSLEEDRGAPMRDFPVLNRGRNLILSCGVLPLVDSGRIMGSMIYIDDVTEVRAEEIRLKRAEGLASLTTMAAGVAHEIKNPLASMSIHLQLMRRRLDIDADHVNPSNIRDTLNVLEEETERLNTIVSDYLFAIRPRESHPEPADINALIRDLLQFLRFEVEEAGVRVIQILDDTVPLLPLDKGSMKRVFLNLVKNALAAMPGGGELRLQVEKEKDRVIITVADTGVGIPESIQGKIFEPYFTTRETGSGLGLTVVYKVIREHGGDLQLDSYPHRGTTFRMSIPIPQSEHKLLSGGQT